MVLEFVGLMNQKMTRELKIFQQMRAVPPDY